MFNESNQNNCKIPYDEYYTKRRIIADTNVQIDIGSAQKVSSSKYLICAHQSQDRINVPNKNNNKAIFDHLDLRKYHIDVDS